MSASVFSPIIDLSRPKETDMPPMPGFTLPIHYCIEPTWIDKILSLLYVSLNSLD